MGVAIGSWYSLDRALISVLMSAVLVMVFAGIILERKILVLCLAIGLIVGVWYVGQSFKASEYKFGESIDVEGIIAIDPPQVDRNQQLTVRPDGKTQNLRASLYQPIVGQKGDRVWIRGTVQPPENYNDFDYIGYLQRYEVYGVLKKPKIIVLKPKRNWRTPLMAVKRYLIFQSRKLFLGQAGSLVLGMLIGERGNISEEVKSNFSKTGLSHVVAVSGFNMTIIVAMCASMAWYLGRRVTNYVTVIIILSFVIITGASASVVRAAIMSLLVILAQFFGRSYTSGYALLWAAGLMVAFNPRILAWDIGFQLSMLATIGVLAVYSQIRPSQSFLKTMIYPTLGAIIMTAPVIAFYFDTLSLIAPIANLFLLPLVPWIMLLGALSFLPLIGFGMSWITTVLVNLFLLAVKFFANLPFSSIEISASPSFILIYYLAITILFLFSRRKQQL